MRLKKSTKGLKAEDFSDGDVAVNSGKILDVQELETEYGNRNYLTFFNEEEEKDSAVFLNAKSKDELIDSFGEETDNWNGKKVKIVCSKGSGKYKNKMLLVKPKAD